MEVCIIGGGASGMAAAIRLAKAGICVTLIEKNDRVGKKILSTGNGKCNLGNMDVSATHYYSADEDLLYPFLSGFQPKDTLAFFDELGLMTKHKNGYLYPFGEQAALVLDVLRHALTIYGVKVITDCPVKDILFLQNKKQFQITTEGSKLLCDKVVIATGGKAAPKTGSDGWGYRIAASFGHRLVPVVPALHPLTCKEDCLKSVAGVRAEAVLSFLTGDNKIVTQRGELQLTANGISGIPVFQISRTIGYMLKDIGEVPIHIDFYPDKTEEELVRTLQSKKQLYLEQNVEDFCSGLLNKKLMLLFAKLLGWKLFGQTKMLTEKDLCNLARLMKHWTVTAVSGASFDQAQVTAGGVPLSELNSNLESKKQKGLYFIGEVVDVDGICGGYNLHWAWCSAYFASKGICGE